MVNRRDVLTAGSLFALAPQAALSMARSTDQAGEEYLLANQNIIDWSYGMKPLFCVAYIDPGIKGQEGQEAAVAKYPIAIVPQDDRKRFRVWRERVRQLNPDIKLLGYQMVIEETSVPGPGHRHLNKVDNGWVESPTGHTPTVTYRTNVSEKRKRIYDPRKKSWQDGFLESCLSLTESGDFDGLFLDQCTVYLAASLSPSTRTEMRESLGKTLFQLRALLPRTLIVGNSSYSWPALNGEMNEGRSKDLPKECAVDAARIVPRLEMFQFYYSEKTKHKVADMFRLALQNRAFFGSTVNAQTAGWLVEFDNVLGQYDITAREQY